MSVEVQKLHFTIKPKCIRKYENRK